MKRILMICILPIIFLNSCDEESSPFFPALQSEYFPLQVGNRWTYKWLLDDQQWTAEVKGTRIIGPHLYFVYARSYPDGFVDTSYFRVDSNNVIIINYLNEDYIYIDFERPIREEWQSYPDFFGYVRRRNLTVTVDAGTFNNVTEVFFDNTVVSDLYEFNHYAPDVGLVESFGFRRASILVSAFVNGIFYTQ
jgi:hypothetical protein